MNQPAKEGPTGQPTAPVRPPDPTLDRVHAGLFLVIGTVLAPTLAAFAAASDLEGDRVVRPVTVAELGVSQVPDVDQRRALLPAGVPFEVHGLAGIGEVRALGPIEDGGDADAVQRAQNARAKLTDGPRCLRADLRVGIGGIEVAR